MCEIRGYSQRELKESVRTEKGKLPGNRTCLFFKTRWNMFSRLLSLIIKVKDYLKGEWGKNGAGKTMEW